MTNLYLFLLLKKVSGNKIYRANINYDNDRIRKKYQKECLVNISALDLIIGLIGKRRYIKIKRVHAFLNILNDEKKLLIGWIKGK